MKEVKAFIKPEKLSAVMLALHGIEGLTGASATDVRGFGRDRARLADVKPEVALDFTPHIRLYVVCRDDLVDQTISVIRKAARTGLRGDGKVYVSNIEQAHRIGTDETGEAAV